jgi:hypothetical protein
VRREEGRRKKKEERRKRNKNTQRSCIIKLERQKKERGQEKEG